MPRTASLTAPRAAAGFTLIELGLALLVVGVLMAIALPTFNGWREKAKVKTAQDDLMAIAAVIDARLVDTGVLPETLAEINRGGKLDPWGRAYRYLPLNTPGSRGAARKDHSLVPLNSDYDLYSVGPDGDTAPPLTAKASRDDILRANNGRFIGPASMY